MVTAGSVKVDPRVMMGTAGSVRVDPRVVLASDGVADDGLVKRPRWRSIRRPWCLMKSAPKIGDATSAATRFHWRGGRFGNNSVVSNLPATGISWPFAARRRVVDACSLGAHPAGYMLTLAPREELDLEIERVNFWTDSIIVVK